MMFTTLRSGLTLPDAAILLAISLEQRQHRLSAKDGALLVSDGSRLTVDDRAQIRTWKSQLLAIVGYIAEQQVLELIERLKALLATELLSAMRDFEREEIAV